MISVKARWEQWCRWNCDLRVINARKKGIFCHTKSVAMTPKSRDHMPTTSLGSHCKMANSSSKDETDTLPERPTKDTAVSVWACQAGFWKSTGTLCQLQSKPHAVFHGVCEIALTEVLATQMGVMWRRKKVSSFELYKQSTFASLRVDCAGACALLYLGSSANCYSSQQHSRLA